VIERVPPHSLENERAVIGCVIVAPTTFPEVAVIVDVDDFFLPAHREIWEAMLAIDKRRRAIDILGVEAELKSAGALSKLDGGLSYLLQCSTDAPVITNVAQYAQAVKDNATMRRLIATTSEINSTSYVVPANVEEHVSEATEKVAAVGRRAAVDRSKTLEETADELLRSIEKVELGEVLERVPTGIPKLDELLKGGLLPEHLIVVIANTSIGKTSWCTQVAFRGAFERKIPCFFVTPEMTRAEIVVKAAANIERINTDQWTPAEGKKIDWEAITRATNKVAGLSRLVRVEEYRDIGRIRAAAAAWRARTPGLALMVVDLIQNIRGRRGSGDSRENEVRGVADDLKAIAKDLKLPVVATSQLDDESEKQGRAPRIRDMRESKAIGHAADVVLGIHRDRMQEEGDAEMIVLKHRGGRTGKRTVRWIGSYQGFEQE
jgi:replicative DNA helicase